MLAQGLPKEPGTLKLVSRLKNPVALAALVSIGLSLLLYGSSPALPFYSDDLLQFPWIERTPLLEFWRAVGPYQDYQPLHFMLWRLLYLSTGAFRPGLARSLNIAGHAVCGVLVGLLAGRCTEKAWLSAPLTSALFVAFPFAFDVVPWASAFCYPLTIALSLSAVLCYLRARERDSRPYHLLAVALTALAGFTYEGGVVTGLVVSLAEASLVAGRRAWRWPAIHLAASAVPLGLIVRFTPVSTLWLSGVRSPTNLLVALQCLAFPVAPLATLLARTGIDPGLAMVWVAMPALCALGHLAHRSDQRRSFWFGLGWVALWSVIPLANLRFNWARDPLRVLYPGAVGTAIMWSLLLVGTFRTRTRRPFRPIWPALILAVLLPSMLFVRGRMHLWRRSGRLLWQVIDAAKDEGPVLFVNLPGRITPRTRLFPLGHEGVIPLPPPTNTDLLVRVHTGREGAAFERFSGAILPSLPYSVELAGAPLADDDLRAASKVMVLTLRRGDEMRMEDAGAVGTGQPQDARAPEASFGQEVALLAVSCRRTGPTDLELRMQWQLVRPVTGNPTVFAHLLAADGTIRSQADGDPLRGLYPFSRWRPGEVVYDVRTFGDAPSGPAAVLMGIWDPATGLRWDAVAANGQPLAHNALRYEVPER